MTITKLVLQTEVNYRLQHWACRREGVKGSLPALPSMHMWVFVPQHFKVFIISILRCCCKLCAEHLSQLQVMHILGTSAEAAASCFNKPARFCFAGNMKYCTDVTLAGIEHWMETVPPVYREKVVFQSILHWPTPIFLQSTQSSHLLLLHFRSQRYLLRHQRNTDLLFQMLAYKCLHSHVVAVLQFSPSLVKEKQEKWQV